MNRVILALACTALATPAMAQAPFAARLAYFSPERVYGVRRRPGGTRRPNKTGDRCAEAD